MVKESSGPRSTSLTPLVKSGYTIAVPFVQLRFGGSIAVKAVNGQTGLAANP